MAVDLLLSQSAFQERRKKKKKNLGGFLAALLQVLFRVLEGEKCVLILIVLESCLSFVLLLQLL